MDFEALTTPTRITYENIADAIGYAYMRDIDPRRVLHLIFKFGRGKASTEIPTARYSEFLTALAELR